MKKKLVAIQLPQIEKKIEIVFTNDIEASQRLQLLDKINELIEYNTGARLIDVNKYVLSYQSKSVLLSSSGNTFGRISGS